MIACPDCYQRLGDLAIVKCGNCGWVRGERGGFPEFLSTRDREAPLFTQYLANYDRIARDDLAQSIQPSSQLDKMVEVLMRSVGPVRGATVCEVGVGQGRLLARLVEAGAEVTGIDIAPEYLERTRISRDARLIVANAENLPFQDEFDVVIASDVLEHVLNPADFVVSMRDAMTRGGRLIVRVPYRENLTQYARRNGCPYDFVHLRNFTKRGLVDLLRDAGLAVESVRFDGFYPWRARGTITRSRVARRLFDRLFDRVLGGERGTNGLRPRVGTLLMVPAEITVTARRL